MSDRPLFDPNFFAQRELAVTRAVAVNRDQWTAPERVDLFAQRRPRRS